MFDGQFFAGAGTEAVVTADVQSLEADAGNGSVMALASLGISNVDGSSFDSSQAWSFDGPEFIDASTPSTLTVRWDNVSDSTQTGQLWVTVSAQAISAVPEPGGLSMMALATLVVAAMRRRTKSVLTRSHFAQDSGCNARRVAAFRLRIRAKQLPLRVRA